MERSLKVKITFNNRDVLIYQLIKHPVFVREDLQSSFTAGAEHVHLLGDKHLPFSMFHETFRSVFGHFWQQSIQYCYRSFEFRELVQ